MDLSIFKIGVSDIDTHVADQSQQSNIYKPSPDKGKDGTYSALIRFLPNPKNSKKSIIKKYTYWLEDPSTGKGITVDSPSTIGEDCPIVDVFWKLRKSESAADKKLSEKLNRKENFYSLVQIINDPNQPELNGKIMIYKYTYKLKQKIDAELNPKFDEPVQIFNLFEGKNFELNITKQGGYANYDTSKFSSKISAIQIDGKKMTESEEDVKTIMKYLESAPDLSQFEFQRWDDKTDSRVREILKQYISPGVNIAKVTSSPVTSSYTSDDEGDESFLKSLQEKHNSSPVTAKSPTAMEENIVDSLSGEDTNVDEDEEFLRMLNGD